MNKWRIRSVLLGSMIAAKIATSSYKVILHSGKEHDFDRTIIKAFGEFRKVLRELAHQQSIRWETVEKHV